MTSTSGLPVLRPLTIVLVAGEPSGDALGGQLIASLRQLTAGQIRILGVGGPAMQREGLVSLFPMRDTAVMGLREVVPRVPAILRRVRQAADFTARVDPDIAVMIDSPDFTHRVARRIKAIAPAIRVVDYVAPQVWAARSYRARKMKAWFDHVLALLPFEVPFFEKAGLPATFVGHPVIERARLMTGGDAFRKRHGIAADEKLLLLLPGSRLSEVRSLLPIFAETVTRVCQSVPGIKVVLPTTPNVADAVRAAAAGWPFPAIVTVDPAAKFQAFAGADGAIAASGTVTTELALAGVPMVVAYRLGWLTAAIARRVVEVEHISIVNLIEGRRVIPEFVQEDCTAEKLAPALSAVLLDPAVRAEQRAVTGRAMAALGQGGEAPSVRAARAVLALARR